MPDREDGIRQATQELSAAILKIRDAKAGKMNFGFEATYGQIYQRLVRLGARPQVKRKYRG